MASGTVLWWYVKVYSFHHFKIRRLVKYFLKFIFNVKNNQNICAEAGDGGSPWAGSLRHVPDSKNKKHNKRVSFNNFKQFCKEQVAISAIFSLNFRMRKTFTGQLPGWELSGTVVAPLSANKRQGCRKTPSNQRQGGKITPSNQRQGCRKTPSNENRQGWECRILPLVRVPFLVIPVN